MYDVVVVGAGPAGATIARLAGRHLRTLLVERRATGAPVAGPGAAKCCGGLLAPDAQQALAELGLGVPHDVLVGPQLFAVRAIDVASGRERHYQRSYLNVDRGRFDAWLRSLLPREVEVRPGCRAVGIRDEGDGVAVRLEGRGMVAEVRARLVVAADGAASVVRRLSSPGAREPERYLAIQEWFEARRPEPCFAALFDPGLTDFYAWVIPKGDRLVVGAALRPAAGAAARFAALVRALPGLGVRLGRSLGREGAMLVRPRRSSDLETGSGRIALVGEAAGFVSPSSAEGVSWALRSARALAAALGPGIEGWAERYAAEAAPLSRALFLKTLKAPFLYVPFVRRAVMASGIGAMAVGEPPDEAAPRRGGAAVPSR